MHTQTPTNRNNFPKQPSKTESGWALPISKAVILSEENRNRAEILQMFYVLTVSLLFFCIGRNFGLRIGERTALEADLV